MAAKLTSWNIDIVSADEHHIEASETVAEEPAKPSKRVDLEGSLIAAVNSVQDDEETVTEEVAEEAETVSEEPASESDDAVAEETAADDQSTEA